MRMSVRKPYSVFFQAKTGQIDMQLISSPLWNSSGAIQVRQVVSGENAWCQRSRVLCLLPTCADNHPLAWLHMRRHRRYARVFAHIPTRASPCRFVPPSSGLFECICVFVCVGSEHCLLETLSKSPQCDNWLPRVLVFLLLIIIIPWRKKMRVCEMYCNRQSFWRFGGYIYHLIISDSLHNHFFCVCLLI